MVQTNTNESMAAPKNEPANHGSDKAVNQGAFSSYNPGSNRCNSTLLTSVLFSRSQVRIFGAGKGLPVTLALLIMFNPFAACTLSSTYSVILLHNTVH